MGGRAIWLIVLLLVGTACGGPSRKAYPTTAQTIADRVKKPVSIILEVPAKSDRLVLYKSDLSPDPQVILVNNAGWGRWQADGYGVMDLTRLGPVSFGYVSNVGQIEERTKGTSHVTLRGKYRIIYGTVQDPEVTWVEVKLAEEEQPTRVDVVNGTWLAWWPQKIEYPPYSKFSLRGGTASGEERFSYANAWNVPEVK